MNSKFTKEELIKQLKADPTRGYIERLSATLRAQDFDLNEMIDITFHPDKQTAFRAAWLLDVTILYNPELYIQNLEYLVKRIKDVSNESCKRQYARIMMHLTAPNASESIKLKLQSLDLEDVVEQFFDWIIDPKVKVAVKAFAADTLFNLSPRYNWIAEELANQIQFMMRTGSPAIQSKGRDLLARLQ
ncbi:hypothetical protein [Mucilaginibacter sp.]|jgi:hypothetical protein|uniref:hypothetical protein n=1 Tax=Mucilaginibacter sp. TaxID=1882438 RepID=UPI00356ACD1D